MANEGRCRCCAEPSRDPYCFWCSSECTNEGCTKGMYETVEQERNTLEARG